MIPPLLRRRRHHRRRRCRPRRRACAEKFRPLRPSCWRRATASADARIPMQASPDVTFDVGCGWLHSADKNSFVAIAEQLGFEVDKNPAALARARLRQGVSARASATISSARSTNSTTAPGQAAQKGDGRQPANLCLEPGNRWNPMIDAISTYINGCELDRVSILDMDAYEDTNINWRVRRGYGALIAAYGAHLPAGAQLRGDADRSFRQARAHRDLAGHARPPDKVIVTVPTNLIADEAIRFSPGAAGKSRRRARPAARPRRQGDAGARRARGAAERRQSARRHHAHRDGHLSSAPVRPALHRRLFRRPLRASAGRRRRRRALPPQASTRSCRFLGNDFRRKLKPLSESRWAHDPFARGSYSHALPGPRGRARGAGGAGGWAAVLCGRSDVAEFLLDRAWGEG